MFYFIRSIKIPEVFFYHEKPVLESCLRCTCDEMNEEVYYCFQKNAILRLVAKVNNDDKEIQTRP